MTGSKTPSGRSHRNPEMQSTRTKFRISLIKNSYKRKKKSKEISNKLKSQLSVLEKNLEEAEKIENEPEKAKFFSDKIIVVLF